MPRKLEVPYASILRSHGDDAPSIEAKLDFVQGRRSDKAESRKLDEFFVTEVTKGAAALEETQEALAKLRQKQEELVQAIEDKLQAAPLHEAFYIETVDAAGRQLARVAHRGARHLAELHEDMQQTELAAGDPIFLAQDLSTILHRGMGDACLGETATVQRRLSLDRVVIRDRDTDTVIQVAAALQIEELKPGDQILWRRDVDMAYEILPLESMGSYVNIEEILETPPQALGGLADELKRILSMFTLSFHAPELAALYGVADYNKSLMLVGPPGCGKTSIARLVAYAVAQKLGVACRFASVSGAELESPWVGETQRNIRQLFDSLNGYDGPAILYVDEIEAIARHRGETTGHHSDKFLSQWLTCLDGFRQREGVAVIASTNRKDLIDAALLERISGKEVHIGRPSRDGAREIFEIYLQETYPFQAAGRRTIVDCAVSRLFDPNADTAVAVVRFRDGKSRTISARELVSGRLIEHICIAARQRAFERHANDGEEGVSHEDVEEAVADAIERLATTLTTRNVGNYVTDLPQDVDVVAVEPVRRKVRRHRYLTAS